MKDKFNLKFIDLRLLEGDSMAYKMKGRKVPLSIRDIELTISRIERNMDKFSRYCDLTQPCRICPVDEICELQTKYYSMLNVLKEIYYDQNKDY